MKNPENEREARAPPLIAEDLENLRRPFKRNLRVLYYIGMIIVGATMILLSVDIFIFKGLLKRQLTTPAQTPLGLMISPRFSTFLNFSTSSPIMDNREKRDLRLQEDNLLVKFKYAYARKSGYESCWVCNKMYQGPNVIPTLAVPLNLSSFPANKSVVAPSVLKLTESLTMPKTNHTIQIANLAYLPLWCFKLKKSQAPPSSICRESLFNVTLDVNDPEVLENDLQERAMTIEKDKQTGDINPVAIAAYSLESLSLALSRLSFKPYYLMPGNGTYICCGTLCHMWINTDIKTWCYLAWVVPLQRIQDDSPDLGTPHPRYPLNFVKQELFSKDDMAWSWFPTFTGWGIEMMKRLNKYVTLMDEIVNITSTDIQMLNLELREIRKVQLYQKLALEQINAALNGYCEMTLHYECCTYISNVSNDVPDYFEVIQNHQEKVAQLQAQARKIAEEGWNPFKGLGAFGSWFGSILSAVTRAAALIVTTFLIILAMILTYKITMCLWPKYCKVFKPEEKTNSRD